MVVSNSKVNTIRKYICKNNLDGFFGIEVNINWKGMPQEGQLPEFFCLENELRTVALYNAFENFGHKQQGGTLFLLLGSWLQGCIMLVKTIWEDGLGCSFGSILVTRFK
jgi:hypothetical protein